MVALCGKAMTLASTCKKNGLEYRYYRCVTRDKAGRKACDAPPLPALGGWVPDASG